MPGKMNNKKEEIKKIMSSINNTRLFKLEEILFPFNSLGRKFGRVGH
jgi:hypothetical protein